MAQYISTFTTGFSPVIPDCLCQLLPGAKILNLYDGLVHYRYEGKSADIPRVLVFHNSYLVLKVFQGRLPSMEGMIAKAREVVFPPVRGSFRTRYCIRNRFVSVPKPLSAGLENKIARATGGRVDRLNPDIEYWLMTREEGVAFFARLLVKRAATEKTLEKGELRPETAYLLCQMASFRRDSVVMDPFAGSGAIPAQMIRHFPYRAVYVSDIDALKTGKLKALAADARVNVAVRDALDMRDIASAYVDLIITDPPWGDYEKIPDISAFYRKMLSEFARVLKPRGTVVLLTARKTELLSASADAGFSVDMAVDTLINGKKAGAYRLTRRSI